MKKKILGLSTALALAGVAGTAQAVNISEDGLGQVLLFPYYTVNGDYDTYINITNTSDRTAMFKIRFREAHNSRDARDFNVILSPYDVWTATVTKAENGNPRIQTTDTTCTAPRLPVIAGNLRGIEFTNLDYIQNGTGGADMRDGGGTSIARTEQGHFEVILMGLSDASTTSGTSVAYNAKHVVTNGVSAPRNCNNIVSRFSSDLASIVEEFDEMGNVLKGSASLLKAGEGKATGYDPVVLANWRMDPIVREPADTQPHLNDTDPWADTLDSVVSGYGNFDRGVDAVSALLMATGVINQFSVNPAANVATDWVVTFPTKNWYVDTALKGTGPAIAPFVENFQTGSNGLSCVAVSFNYFDREERSPEDSSELNFSPVPPGAPGNALCKETNVVTFNNSNVFAAGDISVNVNLEDGYNNGWMDLRFTNSQNLLDEDEVLWMGLPVTGFAYTTREDGVSGSENLSYGTSWNHAYYRSVDGEDSIPTSLL